MAKKTLAVFGLLFLVNAALAEPLRIGVSVLPLESVVEVIGGDLVEARSLQREGDSCSVFEPRPSAVAWLATAEVFLRTGVAYENVLMHKIEDRFPRLRVLDLRRSTSMNAASPSTPVHACASHHDHDHDHGHDHDHDRGHDHDHDHDHGHDHGHAESGDSHLWLDPGELTRVARMVAEVIIEKRPSAREAVEANLRAFEARAGALDEAIEAALAPYAGRRFMIYHAALTVYAERYGLEQISILGSTEPGPRALAERIEEARAEGIRAIFVQPQEDRRQAEIVGAALGARLVEIDPMGRDWEANLSAVTAAMVAVLGDDGR